MAGLSFSQLSRLKKFNSFDLNSFKMKKVFFILASIASSQLVVAQEPADALRYAWNVTNGTARQQAVGGAMASLGGDITATFVNPAGLGFYKTGDLVFTPGYGFLKNKSTYYGRTEQDNGGFFSLGTTGVVLGGGSDRSNRSSAFSIAINRTANFGSNILYRGQQNQSSYSQKFLEEINNNQTGDPNVVAQNFPYGTSLAFNTYWIDTIAGGSGTNYQFQTRSPIATGLLQQNEVINKGGITELAVAGAANIRDKWFFGGTLGLPILNYKREATFTEADATDDETNKFNFAEYHENLHTQGIGFNIKAGFIYKPVERWRLGFAVHSPSVFVLTDNYSSEITTDTELYEGVMTQTSEFLTGQTEAEFTYLHFTPYKLMGSVSYVLHEVEDVRKQKGFLTLDIEYVNYKASSFKPEGGNENPVDSGTKEYLKSLNEAIDRAYKGAFNFRVGGELKFTTIMVRAGAAYYGNPYQDIAGEKGSKLLLSGGLGYRHKGMFIDLTYVHNIVKDINAAYRLQNSPYSIANIKASGGNVVLTLGFKI